MSTDNVPTDRTDDGATGDAGSGAGDTDSHPPGGSRRPGPDALPDRYAAVGIDEGEIAIYDRENPEAWLQSDLTVRLVPPDEDASGEE